MTISNPGTLRITKEEFMAGGNSDPRNPLILKMFSRINIGERAGSGIDKIMTAWREQNWKEPEFSVSLRPERVTVRLEVGQIVYVPGVFDIRYGAKRDMAGALANAENGDVNGSVSGDVSGNEAKNGDVNGNGKSRLSTNEENVINEIRKNPGVTQDEISKSTGIGKRTVSRTIKKLKDNGFIKRLGSDKCGQWEIVK